MLLALVASVEPSAGAIEVGQLARLSVRRSQRQAVAAWLASLTRATRELQGDQSLARAAANLSRQSISRSAIAAPRSQWLPVDRSQVRPTSPIRPTVTDLPPPVERA